MNWDEGLLWLRERPGLLCITGGGSQMLAYLIPMPGAMLVVVVVAVVAGFTFELGAAVVLAQQLYSCSRWCRLSS